MWNHLVDRDASLHPSSSSSTVTVVVRDSDIVYSFEDEDPQLEIEINRKCVWCVFWFYVFSFFSQPLLMTTVTALCREPHAGKQKKIL
jgi:hypothetical protein